MTQSKRAAAEDKAMTAGDLQQICMILAQNPKRVSVYLLGIAGNSMG